MSARGTWISRAQRILVCLRCDDAEIVALCDVSEQALEEAGAQLGVPHLFTDCRQMLEIEPDEVNVCAWLNMRYPVSMAAIAWGMPVFCAKPLA